MGLTGLYSFINQVPDSYKTVNILQELQNYGR